MHAGWSCASALTATAASVSRASAAATSGLRMIVSVDDRAHAERLDLGGAVRGRPRRSRACSRCSRYACATPTHDTSRPSGPMSRSAGPFTGAPPTIGLTATTRSRRRDEHVADAGHREDRPDRDDRVRRADEDRRRRRAARRARPAPAAARSAPSKRTETTGGSRALAHEPLLHRELLRRAVAGRAR